MATTKTAYVLQAGGYSTRMGFPKNQIQLANGNYLFEELLKNIPTDLLIIIANRSNVFWWNKWRVERSEHFNKVINILVEPHEKPQDGYGPLQYLTTNIPAMFGSQASNFIISPLDSFYENYKFVSSLLKEQEAFVVAKYPEEQLKHMGVVKINWKGETESFIEKPQVLDNTSLLKQYYVFTGLFKTTTQTLLKLRNKDSHNLGEYVAQTLSMGIKTKAIKCNCFFRDVGNAQIYEELKQKGALLNKP